MYKPLPKSLKVKDSSIQGQGIFADEDIIAGEYLGQSHHHFKTGEIFRTPLGGFINHSETPNCFILDNTIESSSIYTVRPIKKGEELTVYYRLYNV
jgi:SET domain-containing protein|tara:strand:- start:14328 stop:14615 length:288 start_codon:yes stop_codon:yes gene_type:complete